MADAEFQRALRGLTTSASSVKGVATAALSSPRDYKHHVYEIERFVVKSAAEKRLAGLYVIDAIVRGHEKVKDGQVNIYASRFAARMPATIFALKEAPAKDQVGAHGQGRGRRPPPPPARSLACRPPRARPRRTSCSV
mmetsp:Transcript_66523/g.183757  ORF Transcript_66523/g.183757 Transcript_66523/m.183757 type:complete len:138 (-) Transcript_66523:113-526(-)